MDKQYTELNNYESDNYELNNYESDNYELNNYESNDIYNQTNDGIDEYYSNLFFFMVFALFFSYTLKCCKNSCDNLYLKYKTDTSLSEKINIGETVELFCPICLEEYNDKETICKLNCNHIFHKECIKEWFKKNNNCPNCRKIII